MQTRKSQPSGQRIMAETRQTSFPALSVYPRAGISRSISKTDDRLHFYQNASVSVAWRRLVDVCRGLTHHFVSFKLFGFSDTELVKFGSARLSH